tara:strand:+ start:1868 stop:3505 length:1638 start_codon:yes stop_codon:yes gene_type:complete
MIFLKRNYLYIYIFIAILIAFAHNNSISLWDQDEAAYAGFAKNMIDSGNWLIPDFMWSDIHRKTPLHFWNIAVSYTIFGMNEFSVRFPSTLSIILLYLTIYFWGRKIFGDKKALISTAVLSTTLFIPILAKVSVTDATLLLFSTLCAFCIVHVLQKKSFLSVFVFWIAFALALLTKGPPIIIFCSVFVGILFIFHPNRKNLFQFHPWFFLPVAFAPLFMWGYLTTQIDKGEFISWLIDWYILKRINGSVLGQSGFPGTHLLFITASFIPYLMFFPKALWTGTLAIKEKNNENLLLAAWFVAGWFIYELSPSKLPAYSLVAHVPLAILMGKTINNHIKNNTRPKKWLIILHFSVLLIIPAALLGVSYFMDLSAGLKWSLLIFNILMISCVIIIFKLIKIVNFSYAILAINLLFQLIITLVILPQVDIYKNSTKRVAHYIHNNANPNSVIILANKSGYPPSLPFYNSLFFDKVIEEYNFDKLASFYKSDKPYVLVLSKAQKERFERISTRVKFQEISSFHTDRKELSNYYILMNKKSQQRITKIKHP